MSSYKKGDHVKVAFYDDIFDENEWMWVTVESCDDENRLIFGWLDSQPIVTIGKFPLGQRLKVNYDDIREHRPCRNEPTQFRMVTPT